MLRLNRGRRIGNGALVAGFCATRELLSAKFSVLLWRILCARFPVYPGRFDPMGLRFAKVKVGNPANGGRTEEVQCLVDSGAIYSLVPAPVLRRLGIEPHSTREFVLADGEIIQRRLATATFEYEGRRGDSIVILGEPGDDPLLGVTTLEGFGLVLDPFRRELRPMKLPLK